MVKLIYLFPYKFLLNYFLKHFLLLLYLIHLTNSIDSPFLICMPSYQLQYIGLKSPIIKPNDKLINIFTAILQNEKDITLHSGDIIVIASKIVAMEQNRLIDLDTIKASSKAAELAVKANLRAEFVEVVLKEADAVIGAVNGALLTLRQGDVEANAGVDKSNAGLHKAILLPDKPDEYSQKFKLEVEEKLQVKDIGVLIADSTTRPLRLGTTGLSIGSAGFPAIVDIRGQPDLFGYKMTITLRNIADNIACGANVLMGESYESIPFVIVRGLQNLIQENHWNEKAVSDLRIDPKKCLYFGNMKYDFL